VESEGIAVLGYVNRPTGHVPERRAQLSATGRGGGRRAGMRIALVALRAYDQRAERSARLRAWLATRASTGTATAQP
jgi:hypothetical protein